MTKVLIPVDAVREAAERTIEGIRAERERDLERLITKKMNRWLFPYKNRLSAREAIKNSDVYSLIKFKYRGQQITCERLLVACRVHQGTNIQLSLDELDAIAHKLEVNVGDSHERE